ncbi:MAG: pseudouridine synthase [candidate division Zixibacteria bacterium RBG_16_53_22]|nr:MAG: pseudouridine synthase [candidate division Zixibacteria bacterium RBG_16_53_22]
MRLNKFLAKAGVASRRNADIMIEARRVSINGKTVTELGTQVDEARDRVAVDGKPVKIVKESIYILLHKPVSYLVTCVDNFGRPTVLDLVGEHRHVVRPVGRLDYNSSGLLLLTNDGELAFRLTHPRYEIEKTYQVKCQGAISDETITRLENGIDLDIGRTAPAKIEILNRAGNFTRLNITIHEGRKRQVRLMLQAVGHKVITLKRTRLGNLELGDLREGRYRHLTAVEARGLKRSVGL